MHVEVCMHAWQVFVLQVEPVLITFARLSRRTYARMARITDIQRHMETSNDPAVLI